MYLISDTTEYELPLAVATTLRELAQMCGTSIPVVCQVIRNQHTTRLYHGKPAKIYKITDINDDEKEYLL